MTNKRWRQARKAESKVWRTDKFGLGEWYNGKGKVDAALKKIVLEAD
jgi:hypothetical protein